MGHTWFWGTGFSSWRFLLLLSVGSRHAGSSSCSSCMGFAVAAHALCHVGSSQTRDHTHVPRIGRRILNHWTTREVLGLLLYRICHRLGFVLSLSYVLFIHSSLKPYEIGSVMIPNLRIRTMSQSDGPAHRHNS